MTTANSTIPIAAVTSNVIESHAPPQPALLDPEQHKHPHGNNNNGSPGLRIPPRVPPAQSDPAVSVAVRSHVPNIPPPVSDTALPLVPAASGDATFVVSQAVVSRENSFRVRTALTKGWRKGKKSRKSVGGGRGPGFTSREVDGLLDVLEESVPVTREEWEAVRVRHAARFPGTSRSIDSIRRKFAKVYLARGPPGSIDGHTLPIVRRAKLIRERMAARAVSLDDEDSAENDNMDHTHTAANNTTTPANNNNNNTTSAIAHVEAMDTTGLHDNDNEHEEHHLSPDNEGNATNVQVLEAVPTSVAAASALAPVSLSMVVNDLANANGNNGGDAAGMAGENTVSVQAVTNEAMNTTTATTTAASPPGRSPPRKKQNTGNGGGSEDLLSVFKLYMEQEAESREAERRMRAQEREEQRLAEKAREEREVRRHEQFMQMVMVIAQKQAPSSES